MVSPWTSTGQGPFLQMGYRQTFLDLRKDHHELLMSFLFAACICVWSNLWSKESIQQISSKESIIHWMIVYIYICMYTYLLILYVYIYCHDIGLRQEHTPKLCTDLPELQNIGIDILCSHAFGSCPIMFGIEWQICLVPAGTQWLYLSNSMGISVWILVCMVAVKLDAIRLSRKWHNIQWSAHEGRSSDPYVILLHIPFIFTSVLFFLNVL